MPDIKTEEIWQNLIEQLNSDINTDPKQVQRFFINNIVQRVFAYLYAFETLSGFPKKLTCTSDGCLRVASIGSGYEHNITFSGDASDDYTELDFGRRVSRIDMWIDNYDAVITRSVDGVVYDDEIVIKANTFYSFDCVTSKIKIKNRTSGSNASYQIVGWF